MRRSTGAMVVGALLAALVIPGHWVSQASGLPVSPPDKIVSNACDDFGAKLYRKLVETEKGNVFLSPYSLESALTMTFIGSQDSTARQMREAICLPPISGIDPDPPVTEIDPPIMPLAYIEDGFKQLTRDLNSPSHAEEGKDKPGIELTTVNALWGQKSYHFEQAYVDRIRDVFAGELTPVDFKGDAEGSRKTINQAVAQQTKDRIKDLLPAGSVSGDTRLVLTNAVYFKAAWLHPFEPAGTRDEEFSLYGDFLVGSKAPGDDERSITKVKTPFMVQTEWMRYARTADAEVVELSYAGGKPGDDAHMVIIMPDDSAKLAEMEKNFRPQAAPLKNTHVTLHLPKFKFATPGYELGAALKSFGMVDAFDPGKADFSKITGKRELYISSVIHKAFVDVNETGTEAAAATAVVASARLASPASTRVVKINKPFLFYIEKGTTVLFMGRVMDPRG